MRPEGFEPPSYTLEECSIIHYAMDAYLKELVLPMGLEPIWFYRQILSLLRLPISSQELNSYKRGLLVLTAIGLNKLKSSLNLAEVVGFEPTDHF